MHSVILESQQLSIIKPPLSQKLRSGYVVLEPGKEIGEHITEHKEELITILAGTAQLSIEDETAVFQAGSCVYIPEGKKHNVINMGETTLKYTYTVIPLL